VKALTVRQPWAQTIAEGYKTVEVRSRNTTHRGALVIHAGARFEDVYEDDADCAGFPLGQILCIVDVVDSRPLTMADVDAALLPEDWRPEECSGLFAWVLENPRLIEPVAAKGKLNFWHIDDAEITYQ